MQRNKRTGLIKETQGYTLMQGTAATVESCNTLPFVVKEALQEGKENAISAIDLCTYLGFDSIRELQKEIARERKAGAVILSTCQDGGGYFIPSTDQEVRQFIRTLENRARNTFAALKSAKRLLSGSINAEVAENTTKAGADNGD